MVGRQYCYKPNWIIAKGYNYNELSFHWIDLTQDFFYIIWWNKILIYFLKGSSTPIRLSSRDTILVCYLTFSYNGSYSGINRSKDQESSYNTMAIANPMTFIHSKYICLNWLQWAIKVIVFVWQHVYIYAFIHLYLL